MSAARAALDSELRGIAARPPRLLVPDQQHVGANFEPDALQQSLRTGALRRAGTSAVVVYRVRVGEHQQTGIVVEVSVDDYRTGRIRKHEATDPDRERRLVSHTERAGLEQTPVMLTHTPRSGLRDVLTAVAAEQSDVEYRTPDGQVHSAWVTEDPVLVRAVRDELRSLTTLYIADGHHRMAAADRYAARRPQLDADHPCAYTLGALFPSDEMRVFGYPRGIPRPEGRTVDEVLAALARAPGSTGIEACTASDAAFPLPGTSVVFLDGQWYRLSLRGPRSDVRAALDTVHLDETVIPSVFGGAASTCVPDASSAEALARWCTQRDAFGFLSHPPSVAEIMAVSDADLVMPPKSTWFDPKAPHGLFLRELRRRPGAWVEET